MWRPSLVLNKVDLLPYVPFDLIKARENAQRIHPGIETLGVSCTTGMGCRDGLNG
jgi:hydrogenase nickel incorporation protein HypB